MLGSFGPRIFDPGRTHFVGACAHALLEFAAAHIPLRKAAILAGKGLGVRFGFDKIEIRHELYGFELKGNTLGVLGLGNIGRRLAKRALSGFDMRVMGYDPYVDAADLNEGIEMAERLI